LKPLGWHLAEIHFPDALNTEADWDLVATAMVEKLTVPTQIKSTPGNYKPRLAVVSLLPPVKSGIANYTADLLPVLAEYYQIEVVTNQEVVSDPRINGIFPIRTPDWFLQNFQVFDRIIYSLSNSDLLVYGCDLLHLVPGVVDLHDLFFAADFQPASIKKSIFLNHGLHGVIEAKNSVFERPLPGNLDILQKSTGIIFHNQESRKLAEKFYGSDATKKFGLIPLLKPAKTYIQTDRALARRKLGFTNDDLVICSFGYLATNKLNLETLQAFEQSTLIHNHRIHFIFVGENCLGKYEAKITEILNKNKQIKVTGWVNKELYQDYLLTADIAIQLRCQNLGESSAAILDCMNFGIPTIVNDHGSMKEIDSEAVFHIADPVDISELSQALEMLANNADLRERIGKRARQIIREQHDPKRCAALYHQAIEESAHAQHQMINKLAEKLAHLPCNEEDKIALAKNLAHTFPPKPRQPSLFVDISSIAQGDLKTGIQRVVRSLLKSFLMRKNLGYCVVPVRMTPEHGYVTAIRYGEKLLNLPIGTMPEEPIDIHRGDIIFMLDVAFNLAFSLNEMRLQILCNAQNAGAKVWYVVYDLLPLQFPEYFPDGTSEMFFDWLKNVIKSDGALAISRTIANDLKVWHDKQNQGSWKIPQIGWFHLGATIKDSVPTEGIPGNGDVFLNKLQERPTFLMVGTIEPRKGHIQTLTAFRNLWAEGIDANLLIIGRKGWDARLVKNLESAHPEKDRCLFWLHDASDEYLEKIYQASSCLIAASEGEGFFLPLIEAARYELPILARDLPVFREVAGEHAAYFSGLDAESLAQAVRDWLKADAEGRTISSKGMPWLTWEESTDELLKVMGIQ
jgi:glycosyltransferase involved in cell wall biosynthesis